MATGLSIHQFNDVDVGTSRHGTASSTATNRSGNASGEIASPRVSADCDGARRDIDKPRFPEAQPRVGDLDDGEDVVPLRVSRGTEVIDAVHEAERLMEASDRAVQKASRMRTSDRPRLLSDATRAHELLGWSAQTGLEDGLRAVIERPVAAGITFV